MGDIGAEGFRHRVELPTGIGVVIHGARAGGYIVGSDGKVNRLRAHHEAIHGVGGLVAVNDGFIAHALGDGDHAVVFGTHKGMRVAVCLLAGECGI